MKYLLILLMCISTNAFADGLNLFEPPPTDKILQFFQGAFGGLGVFGAMTTDPLAELVKILNAAVLVFGGIATAYYILFSTVTPSIEGKSLDKKVSFHLMRFVIAVALLLPVIDGKYSMANYGVGWLAKQGIGLAYHTANKAVSDESLSQISASSIVPPDVNDLATQLFLSSVCVNGYQKYFEKTNPYQSLKDAVDMGQTIDDGIFSKTILFGNKKGVYVTNDACGRVSIPKFEKPKEAFGKPINDEIAMINRARAISNYNNEQSMLLINKINEISIKFVEKPSYEHYKDVLQAAATYQKNTADKAYELVKSDAKNTSMKTAILTDGSFALGSFAMRLTEQHQLVNNALARVPEATGLPILEHKGLVEYFSTIDVEMLKMAEKLNRPYSIGVKNMYTEPGWWDTLKGSVTDPTVLIKKMVSSSMPQYDEKDNLIITVQNVGGWSLTTAGAIVAAGAKYQATVGTHPGLGLLGQWFIDFAVTPLVIFGATALYILPMIPYYIWIFAWLSFLITCCGAIIIANFIPATMMLSGNDGMGQAVNAFKQLLSMFFKPALMCISFILSIVLLNLFGQLIMPGFMSVWNLAQDSSNLVTYLVSLIFFPFIMVGFSVYLITFIFTTTNKLPDQLISWIGGAHGFVIGQGAGEGASAGQGFGAGLAGGVVGSAISSFKENKSSNNQNPLAKFDNIARPKIDAASSSSSDTSAKDKNTLSSAMKAASSSSSQDESSINSNEVKLEDEGFEPESNYFADGFAGYDLDKDKYQDDVQQFQIDNPKQSIANAQHYALDSAISWKYGAGVGKAVKAAGGGKFGNEDAQLMMSMFRTAKESGMSRTQLKDIASNINNNNAEGQDAIVKFSEKFNQFNDSKND